MANVVCAVLMGEATVPLAVSVVDVATSPGTTVTVTEASASVPTAEEDTASTAVTSSSVAVRMAYDTTYVSGSDCDTEWLTCNATTSSPSCVALFAKLSGPAVLCSNDPQYLTVSASTSSLDIAYTVSVVVVTGREEGREEGREGGR